MKEYGTEGEYTIVGEIDGTWGGYDWEILSVVYHPGRDAYFLYEDGGCSCNYPYETFGLLEPWAPESPPMDKHDIIKEIYRRRTDDINSPFRLEEYNNLAREVRNFNPDSVSN